ncbi:MAG TPA: DUF4157 domain-containing protein, partial [Chloroflexia bacterium]
RQRPPTAILSSFTRPAWAPSALPILDAQRPPGQQSGLTATAAVDGGHDLSRIPIHSPTPAAIQTKRVVSEPGDADEQEADRQADQVMRASRPSAPEAGGPAPAGPHSGEAMALDPPDRQFFESRFHHNFADVRVYAGRDANESARRLQARAYTVGNSIHFAPGEYRPGTPAGRHLLAHELAHVLQQRALPGSQPARIQRQPEPAKQAPKAPPAQQKTLKEAGVGLDDPVFEKTAQIIDEVLLRNQRLAPYIGDKLKSGLRIAEKGKFVQELSDSNFENSYRTAYDQNAAQTVPAHIVGFYDPKKSEVHVRPDARFGTALHEAVHRLASATLYNYYLPAAMKISGNLAEVLKEGLTAFFTDCILKDEELTNYNDAYRDVKAKAAQIMKALGSDGFDLLAKFNFKGGGIVEIGEKLGLSRKQYADLKGAGQEEVLKRMNKLL